jgi:hypothetical protein
MNLRQSVSMCFIAVLSACTSMGAPSRVVGLDSHATQLRDAFNRRADLVRLVLLVSPT